jgi:hypothetical protein
MRSSAPGGSGRSERALHLHDRVLGEIEYPTYTVEKLVEEFPVFGETVGVYRVRDID